MCERRSKNQVKIRYYIGKNKIIHFYKKVTKRR